MTLVGCVVNKILDKNLEIMIQPQYSETKNARKNDRRGYLLLTLTILVLVYQCLDTSLKFYP